AGMQLDTGGLGVHSGHGGNLQLGLHRSAERSTRDAVAAGQERGPCDDEVGPRRRHHGDQLGRRAICVLGSVVVTTDHRGHDRARVTERLLNGARGAAGAVDPVRPDAGLRLAAASTRVAPICSIAPHNPPYVVRVSPRSFGARSSAPTTRSIAGSVIGSWLLPTFTSASTPGKSKSNMPSALPSVDMSSTTAV